FPYPTLSRSPLFTLASGVTPRTWRCRAVGFVYFQVSPPPAGRRPASLPESPPMPRGSDRRNRHSSPWRQGGAALRRLESAIRRMTVLVDTGRGQCNERG